MSNTCQQIRSTATKKDRRGFFLFITQHSRRRLNELPIKVRDHSITLLCRLHPETDTRRGDTQWEREKKKQVLTERTENKWLPLTWFKCIHGWIWAHWFRTVQMVNKHTHVHTDLAKPTPRLMPCASLRMRVEMTCPKGLRRFSSSCSSIDTGRLDKYRLVGSCSCCCNAVTEHRYIGTKLLGAAFMWMHKVVQVSFKPIKSPSRDHCFSIDADMIMTVFMHKLNLKH